MQRLPRTAATATVVSLATLTATAAPAGAHTGDPAGGTPLEDLVPASIIAALGFAALVALAVVFRRGGAQWLRRLGAFSERVSGIPGHAALAAAVGGTSLVIAVFGFYWDVGTHIDNGRDAGPFANPSHFFILAGLIGIAIAGYLAVLLGSERPTSTSVRLAERWHAPVGGLLLLLCGVVALAGFPLDDVWHRLFGQDVTLWGPTHVQMVGGASLATLAIWALLREAATDRPGTDTDRPTFARVRDVMLGGAFLLGLSTLQGEFDFGVPQFPLLYHPVLLMLAAGIGLVAARIRLGRGGALACLGFFLVIRAALTVLVDPVLGRSTLHFPLYLAEALLVEATALFLVRRDRQLTLGVVAGALIGTVGLAAEWAWSNVWMPHAWPSTLLPEGAIAGFVAALAGGTIGGLVGRALAPAGVGRQPFPRPAVIAAVVAAVACLVYPALGSSPDPVRADVALDEVSVDDGRTVHATVELDPPNAADDALWFEVLAWQGREWSDGGLVRADLEEVVPGTFRTTEPVPVHGEWKAVVRLHRDRSLQALPIFLPEDPAIPAAEVPADPQFTRQFQSDKSLLQREAVGGSSGLQTAGYVVLLAIAAGWLAAMGWGLRRIDAAVVASTTRDGASKETNGHERELDDALVR